MIIKIIGLISLIVSLIKSGIRFQSFKKSIRKNKSRLSRIKMIS